MWFFFFKFNLWNILLKVFFHQVVTKYWTLVAPLKKYNVIYVVPDLKILSSDILSVRDSMHQVHITFFNFSTTKLERFIWAYFCLLFVKLYSFLEQSWKNVKLNSDEHGSNAGPVFLRRHHRRNKKSRCHHIVSWLSLLIDNQLSH